MAGPWGRNHLLLLSLLSTFSFKEIKCKSLINLDFSPSWRREISQRASDYGTLFLCLPATWQDSRQNRTQSLLYSGLCGFIVCVIFSEVSIGSDKDWKCASHNVNISELGGKNIWFQAKFHFLWKTTRVNRKLSGCDINTSLSRLSASVRISLILAKIEEKTKVPTGYCNIFALVILFLNNGWPLHHTYYTYFKPAFAGIMWCFKYLP